MERDCGVYALLNTRTGKVYVGSSVKLWARWLKHMRDLQKGTHCNQHLQHAWQRDGACFAFGVLEHCGPTSLRERERSWIQELQAADREYGYNLSIACDEGFTHAPETRAKIGALGRGRIVSPATRAKMGVISSNRSPETLAKLRAAAYNADARARRIAALRTPETRAKFSAAQKGRNVGRRVGPETRAKLRAARQRQAPSTLSHPHSPETRAKLRAARQRQAPQTFSPETRAKIGAAKKGNTYTLGHKHSPETRAKISAAAKAREARKRAERAADALERPKQEEMAL